jgi:DNA-binding IclR family transcriptional regulator
VANGKVLLAYGACTIGPGPYEAFTKRTLTTQAALQAELREIAARGWAQNAGEIEEGLHAVAAPVFDAFDRCRGAISVSAPAFRVPLRRLPEVARLCVLAAGEISRGLGNRRA